MNGYECLIEIVLPEISYKLVFRINGFYNMIIETESFNTYFFVGGGRRVIPKINITLTFFKVIILKVTISG